MIAKNANIERRGTTRPRGYHGGGASSLQRPDIAIVIPSVRASVERLRADLERRTLRAGRVEVAKDVRPNGRARNEGVRRALAADPRVSVFVFVDDDARLVEP